MADSDSCWRDFLSNFSDHLTTDNVRKIKFQLDIPDGVGEKIKDGLDMVEHLKRKGMIKKDDYSPLYGIIELIGKRNLKGFLEENEKKIDAMIKQERFESMKKEQSNAANEQRDNYIDVCEKYKMTAEPRGLCVIINNTFEKNEEFKTRGGSDKDRDNLKALFEWLKFDVETYNDVDFKFLETVLNLASSYEKNEKFDCFVCCILSHGLQNGFYCNDGKPASFSSVKEYFAGDNCKSLLGKPKLFFIQACQGDDRGRVQKLTPDAVSRTDIDEEQYTTDSAGGHGRKQSRPTQQESRPVQDETGKAREHVYLSTDADFFFYVASVPGTVSWRSTQDGSWFIQELCDVFQKNAQNKEIMQLCREMNRNLSTKSVSQLGILLSMMPNNFIMSLRKELYFHPALSFVEHQNLT